MSAGIGLRDYVLRRILQSIPLIFFIIILSFFFIKASPGDPVHLIVGEMASEELIELTRKAYGLDQPLHIQLIKYFANIFQGNLGFSMRYSAPVLSIFLARLPATLLLMFSAIFFSSFVGIFLGTLSARRSYSLWDNAISTLGVVGFSIPVFWLAQILLYAFAVYLRLFPSSGIVSLKAMPQNALEYVLQVLHHITLPGVALGAYYLALVTRLTRAKMLEVLKEDYIVTAKSKGISERSVLFRHALGNAILPVYTLIGWNIGRAVISTVLIERVFAWPGLGSLIYDAISGRDYPLIMGSFIIVGVFLIIVNLVVDVSYGFLDPRVRYQ
jgi:peptide/nickel transport system permease protein